MTTTPLDDDRRPADRRRGITARGRVLAAAGVVLATVVATSFALFTDSGQVAASFSSGTLDLKFDDEEDGNPTAYAVTFAGATDMGPGSTASRALKVYNSGSVPAVLAMSVPSTTGAPATGASLADEMTLTITDAATSAVLYSGDLVDATVSGGTYLAGIALPAGGSEATATELTFQVGVRPGATVDVAGQSITVTFPFTASQQ